MIRVLIVEDVMVIREFLHYILESDPQVQVVGMARDGEEGVHMAFKLLPDVIVMDINMPRMDGYEATQKIMETRAMPIVLVSACVDPKEVETTFKAMEVGAVAVVSKPKGLEDPDHFQSAQELIQTVKSMSEVKLVTRRLKSVTANLQAGLSGTATLHTAKIELIAIGASTGGPIILQTILTGLSKDIAAPILIVQHITVGFLSGLAEWLAKTTQFPIQIAKHGEQPMPGRVYFAPDHVQMAVTTGRIELHPSPPENGLRPAANYLFRSVAKAYGKRAIGILLTGMGRDGAQGLKQMRDAGAVTFAQSKETCTVFGMPGEAVKLDAAGFVLPPEQIVDKVEEIFKLQKNRAAVSSPTRPGSSFLS